MANANFCTTNKLLFDCNPGSGANYGTVCPTYNCIIMKSQIDDAKEKCKTLFSSATQNTQYLACYTKAEGSCYKSVSWVRSTVCAGCAPHFSMLSPVDAD